MKNKTLCVSVIYLLLNLIFLSQSNTLAMSHYEETGFVTGLVTASSLNVRQGPGTNYSVITRVYKNQYIRVFAKIGNWYVIQTDSNYIGAVSKDYIKPIYPTGGSTSNNQTSTNTTTSSTEAKKVLDLINAERAKNGLSALVMDSELQRVAQIKAQDMVSNNYFSHTSPTYGSPFDMIKNFGISYRTAGENIAGNSTNEGAVKAWMNSQGHRENILNSSYNYTGIGVVESSKYGKVFVQMFIGR